MTVKILAALEAASQEWDAQQLIQRIFDELSVETMYKRVGGIQKAKELIETEEKWSEPRFLIVSRGSVMNAIDPESGTMSSVSLLLNELKERYAFKRHPLVVIGVSMNDMFGEVLKRSGCDITSSNQGLPELILELLTPRSSAQIKLPDDL